MTQEKKKGRQPGGEKEQERKTQPLDVGACTCYVQALGTIMSRAARSIANVGAVSLSYHMITFM